MNTQIQQVKLVLTGPLSGQTVLLNGRQFVKGVSVVHGPANQMHGELHYFGQFYQAFPEGSAEHRAALERQGVSSGQREISTDPVGNGQPQVPGDVRPDGSGAGSEAAPEGGGHAEGEAGSTGGVADGDRSESPEAPERDRLNKIRKALDGLDRSDDALWTKDGDPTVDAVSKAAGFSVSRAEIEAALGVESE